MLIKAANRVLRGGGYTASVVGTHISRAGVGTCTAMRAGQAQVELAVGWEQVVLGAGQVQDDNFLCGQLSVEPKHMNLISSKIAKHMDVLKLFASIALGTVGLQQLLLEVD